MVGLVLCFIKVVDPSKDTQERSNRGKEVSDGDKAVQWVFSERTRT